MKLIEIYDYDGRCRQIVLERVVYATKSTGRNHDDGSVTLDTGETIAFGPGNYYERVKQALIEA